ncbi:hypothetical protein [Amycolatopsis taiwanensis]|uniref:hypothetical protein n=1 Tax=Amycolatopsis taiwanensis TaxID=342230 RepID=UPI0012EB178D|nr:hypothetical protein [Amycolatopsis taiwanensis]
MEREPESVNAVAGSVGGVVQARDVGGDVTINNYSASSGARGRHRVGVVPARAGCFQDRAVSAELAQAITESRSVVLVAPELASTRVLSGLGGVGKTQLAADYAERVWAAGEIDLLVWVAAGSRDAIVSTYATAASELGWHNDGDTEQGSRRACHANRVSRRWPMIDWLVSWPEGTSSDQGHIVERVVGSRG